MDNKPTNLLAPYDISPPRYSVSHHMVTSAFEIPGFRIIRNLGIVRGIVVRSRNVFVNIGAAFQSLAGGNITAWTKLCEQTRSDAFEIMVPPATELATDPVLCS